MLKFNLLENCLDSLIRGIEFALKRNDESDLKLSILLVAHAVELGLKERLYREHWSLIFTKIEQAGQEDAYTVTIKEAKNRLIALTTVRFDKKAESAIENISKQRNRIQHYQISIDEKDAISLINRAIGFLIEFVKDELQEDIKDLLSDAEYAELIQIQDLYKELISISKTRVREKESKYNVNIFLCPDCFEELYTFSVDPDISECQFCGFIGSLVTCARCGEQEIYHGENPPEFYLCASCREYIEKE